MSSRKNDEKILEIKSVIEKKEKELKGVKPYRVLTNCQYVDPITNLSFNIRVATIDSLNRLATYLNSFVLSAENLRDEGFFADDGEMGGAIIINGYSAEDWLADMKGLKDDLVVRQKKQELASAKAQLEKLLSDEKQTELAIGNIISNLGL